MKIPLKTGHLHILTTGMWLLLKCEVKLKFYLILQTNSQQLYELRLFCKFTIGCLFNILLFCSSKQGETAGSAIPSAAIPSAAMPAPSTPAATPDKKNAKVLG